MRRALFASFLLLLARPGVASPQGIITVGMIAMRSAKTDSTMTIAAAKSPSECNMAVSNEYGRMYRSSKEATPRQTSDDIWKKAAELYRTCAQRFAKATLPVEELLVLSELFSRADMRDQAVQAAARARSAGRSAEDTALALEAVVKAALSGPKVSEDAITTAESYAMRLASMPARFSKYKISAHMMLAGAYPDTVTAIEHAEHAISAAKETPMVIRRNADSMRAFGRPDFVEPYLALAEFYAKRGQRERAENLLTEAAKDFPLAEGMIGWRSKSVKQYFLVGQAAPELAASNWINAPAGTKKLELAGVVTLIEATAHW
jgi:hypothetical protein